MLGSLPVILGLLMGAPLATAQDPPHNQDNGISCTTCHVFDFFFQTDPDTTCLSCHNPLGVIPVTTHGTAGNALQCITCHDPHTQEQEAAHGSTYSKLIRTLVATPFSGDRPVKLMASSGPHSFADGDGEYDGICEVCHTQTDYHRNNPTGNHEHNVAKRCTACHIHGAGFLPVGGDCLDCHNQEQPPAGLYRRQVVENMGDGGGDFIRAAHHVNDLSGTEIVTGGDCIVCHDQSRHQANQDPGVYLNDPDGGPPHTYTGSSGGMAVEFCVACHDDDAQGGNLQPFSSGRSPVNIDQHWSNPAKHGEAAVGVACLDCHANGHGGDNPSMQLNMEELLCLSCHTLSYGITDIEGEFAKAWHHPVEAQSGTHAIGEDPYTMARHVECADCHNPHAANLDLTSLPPATPGGMLGVSGIDGSGNLLAAAANGYEVCYKCHAATNPGSAALPRIEIETDVSVEFDPGRASYHPIEAAGKNAIVPSLMAGWSEDSIVRCENCHAGDSDIRGPHGSSHRWILKENYTVTDEWPEFPFTYALCYTCHDRDSILNNDSFPLHYKHVVLEQAPCSACHDAHGSSNTHLINFRSDLVTPNGNGDLSFQDDGDLKGTCNLHCHGKPHIDRKY